MKRVIAPLLTTLMAGVLFAVPVSAQPSSGVATATPPAVVFHLPNGFSPEGIAIDRRVAYTGSLVDGSIERIDLKSSKWLPSGFRDTSFPFPAGVAAAMLPRPGPPPADCRRPPPDEVACKLLRERQDKPMTTLVGQTIQLSDLTFGCREAGNPDAPPLVLLHALTSDARDWDEIALFLAQRYHVFALDQRGHGRSAKPGSYSFELVGDDLDAFAEALDLARFTLIGHSLGGGVACLYASQFPERIERMVLEDSAPIDAKETVDLPVRGIGGSCWWA